MPHSAAPMPGAVRSQPRPVGPDVQHVGRVHRQQRRRAAEQHREQVERDGAEHERASSARSAGPTSSVCQPGGSTGAASSAPPLRTRSTMTPPTSGEQRRDGAVARPTRPARYTRPPSAGPAMVATCQVEELSATAVPNCARGTRFGSIAWPVGHRRRRAPRRTAPSPRTPATPSRGPRAANASSSSAQRHSTAKQAARMRRRSQRSARCPAGSDQQHERQELRQADEPEVERIARDLVHLPADRHGLHLHGERRDEARRDEAREVAVAQHRATRVGGRVHAGARPVNEAICDVRIARRGRAARLRSDRRSAAR